MQAPDPTPYLPDSSGPGPMSTPLDPEAILDRLYAAPLTEFVSLRNEAEKALKGQGRKEEAAKVKALRKPSVAAWTVNQLSFQAGEDLAALVEANRSLAEAHGGSTGDLADAIQNRKACLARLTERARGIMADHGLRATKDQLRRLNGTLEAATRPGASLPPGRLVEDLEPAGFGALAGLALAAPPATAQPPAPKKPQGPSASRTRTISPDATAKKRPGRKPASPPPPTAKAPVSGPRKKAAPTDEADVETAAGTAARMAAESALKIEEDRLARTERLLARAEADAGAAHRRVDRAKAKLAELEKRLDKAKAAVQDATAEANTREHALAELKRDLADAQSRVGKAGEALDLARSR